MYNDLKEIEQQLSDLSKEKLALEKVYYRFYDRLYYAILENSDYLLSKFMGKSYNENVIKINLIYYKLIELEDSYEKAVAYRQSLIAELNAKDKEFRNFIKDNPDVVAFEEMVKLKSIDTEKYISLINESLDEAKYKLTQYSDPLFTYLLRLNFGTEHYKRSRFFASIDYWISSKTKYLDNFHNYYMLVGIIERGNELINIANNELEKCKKDRDDYIRSLDMGKDVMLINEKLSNNNKIIKKKVQYMDLLNRDADIEIKQLEHVDTDLRHKMRKLFKEPIETQVAYLKKEVSRNPSDKDDFIFRRLLVISHRIHIKSEQIKELENKLNNFKMRTC